MGRGFVNSVMDLRNTKLQMLFRGQNILGYRPYADDVVEYFVQKSIANGIDIIRIFDCLNDLRNLEDRSYRSEQRKRTCTGSFYPILWAMLIHMNIGSTLQKGLRIWGANSVCLKDMAGFSFHTKQQN